MSEKATFDLAGLCGWAVDKAVKHIETKTSLPLGELVTPLAQKAIQNSGISTALEIDPLMVGMARLVMAGMEAQKKRTEARIEQDANRK